MMPAPDDLIASYFTLSGAGVGQPAAHSFADRIKAAAAAGYVGIGLTHEDYDRLVAGTPPSELRAIADDHGVAIAEIEFLAGWASDGDLAALSRTWEQRLYDMADVFGAHHMNVGIGDPPGSLPPLDAVAERFAGVCDRAAEHGLLVAIEFMPFFAVGDAATALAIATTAGRPNGGILLDCYHWFRGTPQPDAVRAAPDRVVAVQLDDVDADVPADLIAETTTNRRLPGDGAQDVAGLLRLLADAGAEPALSVEVLSTELWDLPVDESAQRSADAARAVIARARRG
ncbi:MAG TPA: sugar phosphate isomerase/epimerase [Acidimicrobiales bacterium]|nr:sugar phosphate isomerase/epimerase [Acidimicrobiales bacterium]